MFFWLNAIDPQINNNAISVIVANTEAQEVQPLKKLNLFGGHIFADVEEEVDDILDELRGMTSYYYLVRKKYNY